MSAQAASYRKHSLDGFGASFFHHIGRAKFLSQRNAVAMMAQHDDLFGSKSARCYHTTQSYRAVTYNRSDFAGRNLRSDGRVMTCAHHIGKS